MTESPEATSTNYAEPRSDEGRRELLIKVAAECFERYGLRKTTIEDVAAAAGISRTLVYRYFVNRDELVDAVRLDQVHALVDEVRPSIEGFETFAEAVVEGSLLLVNGARHRPEMWNISTANQAQQVAKRLLRSTGATTSLALQLWQPVLDRARERGEIRSDFDELDFMDWLANIHMLLLLREDLDPERVRVLLYQFLVPAISYQSPPTSAGRKRKASASKQAARSA